MEAIKPFTPTMVGGAADLVESTKTEFKGGGLFSATHAGRNIAVRHPRARDGRDRQRHRAARRDAEAVRLDVPHLLATTCAPPCGSRRCSQPAGRLGVDARLGRPRRGRPDAPAGRALRRAARDPELLVRPPGGRERDGRRVEGRARARGRPRRARADAAEAADARADERRGRRPRRVRLARSPSDGAPDADPRRDRLRGARSRSRRPTARCDGADARRLDAVLGAVRGAARRLPRRGAAAGRDGAALGRGRRRARLEALGRRRGRLDLDRALRRLGARPDGPRALRLHGRQRRRARPRAP